jgi:hypothetical protein
VIEQLDGRRSVERLGLKRWQAGTIEEALSLGAQRGQETDTGSGQSTSCRSQHQRARSVQPRQVVDDHEQRSSRRRIAKQPEDRVRDH